MGNYLDQDYCSLGECLGKLLHLDLSIEIVRFFPASSFVVVGTSSEVVPVKRFGQTSSGFGTHAWKQA